MFGILFLWRALTTPYRGFGPAPVTVEVRRGWNSGRILRELRSKGVLRDDFVPLIYLKSLRRGESLKAGIYRFDQSLTAVAAIDKLIRGDVILRTVTIREGLDRFQVADVMRSEGFGTVEQWKTATSRVELIRDLDLEAETLEGYLFPDTYKLSPGTTPQTIVKTMTDNFRKHFGNELAYIHNGLGVHDTVTLASIVETEARLPEERPIIASVYLNRLRRDMPLQADPTVIYAMKLNGTWNGNIRKTDLRVESPYNTYRVKGLPPGPIVNPGLESLRAASDPAATEFLYFVARNDGSHVFSRNLQEHNHNVQIYQRNFWRNRQQAPNSK